MSSFFIFQLNHFEILESIYDCVLSTFFLKHFFIYNLTLFVFQELQDLWIYILNEIKYCLDNQLKDKCEEII